jgi:CheY-like chemotaxis protein
MVIKFKGISRERSMDRSSDAIAATAVQEQGRKVLVVDDNSQIRAVISVVLEREGCRVTQCSDGMSAVTAAKEDVYDAILIDYSMPGPNGAVVTEMLRPHAPRMNIIGISLDDRSNEFLAAGADAFLTKPFDTDEMLRLLKITRSAKQDRENSATRTFPTDPTGT